MQRIRTYGYVFENVQQRTGRDTLTSQKLQVDGNFSWISSIIKPCGCARAVERIMDRRQGRSSQWTKEMYSYTSRYD